MLRNASRVAETQCYSWKANKRSVPSYYRGQMQSLAEQGRVRIFVNFGFTKE